MKPYGLDANSTTEDIEAAFDNTDAINEAKQALTTLQTTDEAIITAADNLAEYGLDGNVEDDDIKFALIDRSDYNDLRIDRSLLQTSDIDPNEAQTRLDELGVDGDTTAEAIYLILAERDHLTEFEARKGDRDTLALYDSQKIIGLGYRDSNFTFELNIENIDIEGQEEFSLNLRDLANLDGIPDTIKDLSDVFNPTFYVHDDTVFDFDLELETIQPLDANVAIDVG